MSSTKTETLNALYEENPTVKNPPQATIARRAKSYSDFYHVARAHLTKDSRRARREEKQKSGLGLENKRSEELEGQYEEQERDLLSATQEEYQ